VARRAVHAGRHRRLAARRQRARREGQPPGRGRRAQADVVLFVVDASVGLTEDDESVASGCADRGARSSWWPTRPTTTAARTTAGSSWRSASASRRRSARCTAAVPATCSTRSSSCCPKAPASPTATSPLDDEGEQLWNPNDVAAAPRGHRRPPQRGQEHPVQPARRRGPLGGARHGRHHPRRDRHAGRHARRPDRVRRHRRHAQAAVASTTRPSTTRWCVRCGPSTTPTSRCWSSMPPRASPARISAWPSASTRPAARSW
jgi:hypothetical protein